MAHKREFVSLESLVNTEHLKKGDAFRLEDFKYSTTVREKNRLALFVPSIAVDGLRP